VQFKALDQISPVTHAVGNTMRRVVIMVVCAVVFGTPVTLLGGIGSAIAIAGSYAYAMAKTYEKQQADASAAAAASTAERDEPSAPEVLPVDHPLLPLLKLVGSAVSAMRRKRA
jgi:hypothetical protein